MPSILCRDSSWVASEWVASSRRPCRGQFPVCITKTRAFASAAINTMQQVGGSIGTALLSTIAASASSHYLVGRELNPLTQAHAAVESYTTAFYWTAGIYAVGAVLTALVLRSGLLPDSAEGEPVIAH